MIVTEKDFQIRREIYNDYIRQAKQANLSRNILQPKTNHIPRIAKWVSQQPQSFRGLQMDFYHHLLIVLTAVVAR